MGISCSLNEGRLVRALFECAYMHLHHDDNSNSCDETTQERAAEDNIEETEAEKPEEETDQADLVRNT